MGHAVQGDVHVGAALALAIGMGYLYQGPPFRHAPPDCAHMLNH